MDDNKLDNPAWYSLQETHQRFAMNDEGVCFYKPEICPFGGFTNWRQTGRALENYSRLADNFFVIGKMPVIPDSVVLKNELVCDQMLLTKRIDHSLTEKIVYLNDSHIAELFDLVNLVQPGYYRKRTHEMGDYFGIFKDGQLVAIAGERMRMDDQTEISAVVTHPGFTGRGYARQLVTYITNKIVGKGKQPYLHVAEINNVAIHLYEQLGYTRRRKISFWNFIAR